MTDTFDNNLVRVPIFTTPPDAAEGPESNSLLSVDQEPRLIDTILQALTPKYESTGGRRSRSPVVNEVVDTFTTDRPDKPRQQLWPERMVRSGLTLAGDVAQGNLPPPGLRREDYTDVPADPDKVGGTPYDDLIQRAQDMAGLAMSGGILGTGEGGVAMGSGPSIRTYHGSTARNLKAIESKHAVETPGVTFHSSIPEIADTFTVPREYGEPVYYDARGREIKPGKTYATELSPKNLYEVPASEAQRFIDDTAFQGQVIRRAREAGHDAVVARNVREGIGERYLGDVYAALHDGIVRINKKGHSEVFAKNEAAAPLSALERGPVWFSPVEHALEQSTTAKATGAQWLATLRNSRGVKPEELDWTGLRQYLEERAGKPVSRPELHEYLRDHRVELQDVTKGEGRPMNWDELSRSQKIEVRELWEDAMGDGPGSARRVSDSEVQKWFDGMDSTERLDQGFDWSVPTKYQDYQLPGGENYREHLITMPTERGGKPKIVEKYGRFALEWPNGEPVTSSAGHRVEYYTRGDAERAAGSYGRTGQGENTYVSSHWDEPNIVAHVRSNVREMAGTEGKPLRSLHLEEVQSDWHQAGRRKGYQGETDYNQPMWKVVDENGDHYGRFSSKEVAEGAARNWERNAGAPFRVVEDQPMRTMKEGTVPDAPWKKTWHELALRRMIRQAAEEGMDRISWTPGEAQAARYDLSKQVQALDLTHNRDGLGELLVYPKNGGVQRVPIKSKDDLVNTVGKEYADKLYAMGKENNGRAKLEGVDLKIGGEGMRGFYDKMMVQAAEKLGREYGVRVRQGTVPGKEITKTVDDRYSVTGDRRIFDTRAEAEKVAAQPVWYFDIPPAMREAALGRGMPLFSGGKMFVPSGAQPSEKRSEK